MNAAGTIRGRLRRLEGAGGVAGKAAKIIFKAVYGDDPDPEDVGKVRLFVSNYGDKNETSNPEA